MIHTQTDTFQLPHHVDIHAPDQAGSLNKESRQEIINVHARLSTFMQPEQIWVQIPLLAFQHTSPEAVESAVVCMDQGKTMVIMEVTALQCTAWPLPLTTTTHTNSVSA